MKYIIPEPKKENKQVRQPLTQEQIQQYLDELEANPKKDDIQADLHNHTKGSDGAQSPLMLLMRASRNGKDIVSMSDHDSVKGYHMIVKQVTDILVGLEELNNREDVTDEEKRNVRIGAERLLRKLEEIKILPAVEMITTYRGIVIEVLGYNIDIDILESEMDKIHEGLVPVPKLLTEGVDRVIKDNNLEFDRFVIDNRSDFKKLFYHEFIKHPENKDIYSQVQGETEENRAEEFSKMFLENKESEFFVDLNKTDDRSTKDIRADILKMIDNNKDKFKFDPGVIENSHAVIGEFYNELIKHPENVAKLNKSTTNLKQFIYGELYNPDSVFFVDVAPSRPSLEDTIGAIKKSGGLAFLAHPGRYEGKFDIKHAISSGDILKSLDGIEVFYPDHYQSKQNNEKSKEIDIDFLLDQCRQKGLYASGGSDDHKVPKDGPQYKMGTVDVPDIPETQWINDSIKTGKDFINQSIQMKNLILRLRALKNEKSEKSAKLQEKSKENSK